MEVIIKKQKSFNFMSRPQNSMPTVTWPQIQPIRAPKKSKMTPKLSENQDLQLKKAQKMKIFQLYEQTRKLFLNPTPTPKMGH